MEEVTHCDYDYDTDCENKFAFAPNKFFTPPVLQQQSAFLDIFSDIDLQMLLVAHMYNSNTEDYFLRAVARLMGAAKLFRVQAELPHPNEMRAHIHHVQVSSEGDIVQVLGVDDAFTKELAVAVKELWR